MMKKKNLVKLKLVVVLAFLIGLASAAGYYFIWLPHTKKEEVSKKVEIGKAVVDAGFGWKFPVTKFPLTGSTNSQLAYSDIRDPGGTPRGLPVRLKIPSIGVSSAIEDALITADGRMDVPAGSVNVAWFSLGPHPGQVGSAVIGGHFGITNGKPFVFYNLDKVKIGDKVYIEDDEGNTLAFVVKSTKSFDRDADSTTVFTSGDGLAHLNLITCEGTWNQVNDSYPQRLVVFTDAIPSEGGVQVNSEAAATPKPALPKTAIKPANPTPGPTVAPTPVPLVESPVTPEPTTSDSTATQSSFSIKQSLTPYFDSLFGSALDAAVSSLLIILIIFVSVKILRK